jgi:glycosyltransferase involved in cell wall biosynthesis
MDMGHQVLMVTPPLKTRTMRQRIRGLLRGEDVFRSEAQSTHHLDLQGAPYRFLETYRPVEARDVPDADVVIATWWETAEWIRPFPPRKGAKAYFVQGHEADIPGQPKDRVHATWRLPYHKIAVSSWLAGLVTEVSGDSDVTLAPNGVDVEQFYAPPRGRQSRPTVAFLYAPVPLKGVDVTLRAVRRLRERFPDLRVMCFGAEPERDSLRLPPGTEFFLRPSQDAIREIYASADVWLAASRAEGFGLTVLEAMACRCPAVSTRFGGPMDFIDSGRNGFLVDVDDHEALASRAAELLSCPEPEWRACSQAAYETAAACRWEDATTQFLVGLERAVEKAPSEPSR